MTSLKIADQTRRFFSEMLPDRIYSRQKSSVLLRINTNLGTRGGHPAHLATATRLIGAYSFHDDETKNNTKFDH